METDEAVTTGAKRAREWCHVRTICARVPARARACAPYRLFWDRLPSLTRDQGRSFRWLSWQIRLLYCIIAESRRQIFSRVSVCFQQRITIYVRSYWPYYNEKYRLLLTFPNFTKFSSSIFCKPPPPPGSLACKVHVRGVLGQNRGNRSYKCCLVKNILDPVAIGLGF